jgi:hypothetical protein
MPKRVNLFTSDFCKCRYGDGVPKLLVERRRRPAMKTIIIALALVFALAGGISMMALALRADFRGPATDNGGNWTMSESPRSNAG